MKNTKRILVLAGGTLDTGWAFEWLKDNRFDYVIAADKGLVYAESLGIKADYILGDYDSVDKELLDKYKNDGTEIVKFPSEKDFTDTNIAIEAAIEKGAAEIAIIGATGGRLDHELACIHNMLIPMSVGVRCFIYDRSNRIHLSERKTIIKKSEQYGKYVSIIPLSGIVRGITLSGFHYPLKKYDMVPGVSIGISNEIIDHEGVIESDEGVLVVFETKD